MVWQGLVILSFLLVSFYHLEGIQGLQDKEKVIHQKPTKPSDDEKKEVEKLAALLK